MKLISSVTILLILLFSFSVSVSAKQNPLVPGNVNGDPGGTVDLDDLTALIDYLFISFTPPAECL